MKLIEGIVLSVLVLGLPLAVSGAPEGDDSATDDSTSYSDTNDSNSTELPTENYEVNSDSAESSVDNSDVNSDTAESAAANSDSSSNNSNMYAYNDNYDDNDNDNNYNFDPRYKKYAYNTPQRRQATGRSTFIFDPNQLRWYAYDRNGELVGSGRASGGKGYCADVRRRCKTPAGTFRLYSMGGPGCVSTKFPIGRGGAPMPYCMFFHGGFAIHGSNDVPNHNASHGCIRVEPSAARWLQQNVLDYGSTVIVRPY